MEEITITRNKLIAYYRRFENNFNIASKFIFAIITFAFLNSIGLYSESLSPFFTGVFSIVFILLFATLFAISPPTVGLLLISIVFLLQISSSLELLAICTLFLLAIYTLYGRLAPKKMYITLIIIYGFIFQIPLAVVLFCGIFVGISSIIPITIGVFVWSFNQPIVDIIETANKTKSTSLDILSIPIDSLETIKILLSTMQNDLSWIYISILFSVVVLCVHLFSKLTVNYANTFAISIGSILSVIGFLAGGSFVGDKFPLLNVIIGSIISFVIVFILLIFKNSPDFGNVSKVEFEDEENYYYVKVIPKRLQDNIEDYYDDIKVKSRTVKKNRPNKLMKKKRIVK